MLSDFRFVLVIGIGIGILSAGITSIAQDIWFHDTLEPTLVERVSRVFGIGEME
jgi:hypothetical protein